ncbi:MAG: DUF4892 domain-containing protein [Halioglobus sp.]
MTLANFCSRSLFSVLTLSMFWTGPAGAAAPSVETLIAQLNEYPHTRLITSSEQQVIDHEIGLGAIQKVRGEWHFKKSERKTGTLQAYTWLIGNGFSAAEVMSEFLKSVAQVEGTTELFNCDGRACGRAVQWANRVFNERVLYGREDLQRYRVYSIDSAQPARLLVYSAERSEDRQYLHVELLVMAAP